MSLLKCHHKVRDEGLCKEVTHHLVFTTEVKNSCADKQRRKALHYEGYVYREGKEGL